MAPLTGLIAGTLFAAVKHGDALSLRPAAIVAAYFIGAVPAALVGAVFAAVRGTGDRHPRTLIGVSAVTAGALALALTIFDQFVTLGGVLLFAAVCATAGAVCALLTLRVVR